MVLATMMEVNVARAKDRLDAWYFGRRRGGDRRIFWLMFAVCIVKPAMHLLTRRRWSGMRNVPLTGGVIFAVNHISQADPPAVAHYVYNSGRNPRFLAKAGVFKLKVIGDIISRTGQIPVYRGSADAVKSLHAAIEAVNQGFGVIVYPEGTTTRQPQHWPMKGRTGVARLALETGAPVIPVTVWGPHHLFDPVRKKLRLRPRTPVSITAGEQVDLTQWAGLQPSAEVLEAMTEAVMLRLRDQLATQRGQTPPPLYDHRLAKPSGKDS
jgi:1-acyl-sn-glycerol-3-phosphate acyltransferase